MDSKVMIEEMSKKLAAAGYPVSPEHIVIEIDYAGNIKFYWKGSLLGGDEGKRIDIEAAAMIANTIRRQ